MCGLKCMIHKKIIFDYFVQFDKGKFIFISKVVCWARSGHLELWCHPLCIVVWNGEKILLGILCI